MPVCESLQFPNIKCFILFPPGFFFFNCPGESNCDNYGMTTNSLQCRMKTTERRNGNNQTLISLLSTPDSASELFYKVQFSIISGINGVIRMAKIIIKKK